LLYKYGANGRDRKTAANISLREAKLKPFMHHIKARIVRRYSENSYSCLQSVA
jgi:hypothetical protein